MWGKDALQFNPERDFTEEEIWREDINISALPMESKRFSPFSFSRRNCIGKMFSHIEMRMIILYLIRDFHFVLSPLQKNVDSSDLSSIEFNKGTMGPRNKIKKYPVHQLLLNIISRHSSL